MAEKKTEAGPPPVAQRSTVEVKLDKVPIVFLKKSPPYNAGEVAGFPAETAENLVKQKIARVLTPAEVKAGGPETK
ncbi:hypothetical protein [Roseimaritima ulvae]|uniref:Uncharacterized protein n=1 Tax=Roseimaritima ulvae TaxID=980254 RepID=A0A5B9QR63_9BACT|nr:hypothetical protein [Roseimaritima ulvae]QEG40432.1 hypothetical protein UC8_24440 [Roseimaritima ulvae]